MHRLLLPMILFAFIALPAGILAQTDLEITAPLPVSQLSDTVAVRGTVNLPDLQSYFLEVAAFEIETPHWIPVSLPQSEPVIDDILLMWNTRTLPDDIYRLRLHAITCDGQHHFAEVSPVRLVNGLTCPIALEADMPCPVVVAPTSPAIPALPTIPAESAVKPPDDPAIMPATEPSTPVISAAGACEDFTATFTVDASGFEMPWSAFAQGAFHAFSQDGVWAGDIPIFEHTSEVQFEARVDGNDVEWENVASGQTHWDSILDRLPLWIDSDTLVYEVSGYTVDVAPGHTRTYGDLTLGRATPQDMMDALGADQLDDDIQASLREEADEIAAEIVYIGELTTIDRHTNGNMAEMHIMVQAVYDGDGLLMGTFLWGQYGDCIGCGGQVGMTQQLGDWGVGWMVFTERTQTSLPPAECRQLFFAEDVAMTPTILTGVTATYRERREGVSFAWGDGQFIAVSLAVPERLLTYDDMEISDAMLSRETFDQEAINWQRERDAGQTSPFTIDMTYGVDIPAHEWRRVGVETITVAGITLDVVVHESTPTKTLWIQTDSAYGELQIISTRRTYRHIDTGLVVLRTHEDQHVSCTLCSGVEGDFYDRLLNGTDSYSQELVETNLALDSLP